MSEITIPGSTEPGSLGSNGNQPGPTNPIGGGGGTPNEPPPPAVTFHIPDLEIGVRPIFEYVAKEFYDIDGEDE